MGILKKLFGSKDRKEETAKIGPEPSSAPEPRKRVVRAPRVPVTALHRIDFVPEGRTEPVRLTYVSTTGLGLLRISFGATPIPAEGSTLKGQLRFQDRLIPLELKIVHLADTIVGCAIQYPAQDLKSAISKYFELEIAALSMSRVDPKYHKKETDGAANWIHGGTSDLYYVTDGDRVLRFRLHFMGNQFEGGETIPVYVGQIAQDNPAEVRTSSKVLHERENVPQTLLDAVRKFLEFVPTLEPRHREAIQKILSQVATLMVLLVLSLRSEAQASADLFHRIGGKKKLANAVSDLIETLSADQRLLANPKLREASRKANKPRLKMQITENACHLTGGPCRPAPLNTALLPAGFQLSTKEWYFLLQDLNAVLARSEIPKREQAELITLVIATGSGRTKLPR